MQTPFSLRIFVADGGPAGLRFVDKSNWIGKALVYSRAQSLRLATLAKMFVAHTPPNSDLNSFLQGSYGWLDLSN